MNRYHLLIGIVATVTVQACTLNSQPDTDSQTQAAGCGSAGDCPPLFYVSDCASTDLNGRPRLDSWPLELWADSVAEYLHDIHSVWSIAKELQYDVSAIRLDQSFPGRRDNRLYIGFRIQLRPYPPSRQTCVNFKNIWTGGYRDPDDPLTIVEVASAIRSSALIPPAVGFQDCETYGVVGTPSAGGDSPSIAPPPALLPQ
jgi:hypothetical protein